MNLSLIIILIAATNFHSLNYNAWMCKSDMLREILQFVLCRKSD